MATIAEVLGWHDITVPDDVIADIEVPVLSGPQRQGDVLIVPAKHRHGAAAVKVTSAGVPVVRGEATGNAHLLHSDGDVTWEPVGERAEGVLLGWLTVAEGSSAWLIHTDEHGANGIAPGAYALHGKREQAEEIRRVAD